MELDFQVCISVPLRWRHPIKKITKYHRVISIFTIPCTSNKYAIYKNILFQRIGIPVTYPELFWENRFQQEI